MQDTDEQSMPHSGGPRDVGDGRVLKSIIRQHSQCENDLRGATSSRISAMNIEKGSLAEILVGIAVGGLISLFAWVSISVFDSPLKNEPIMMQPSSAPVVVGNTIGLNLDDAACQSLPAEFNGRRVGPLCEIVGYVKWTNGAIFVQSKPVQPYQREGERGTAVAFGSTTVAYVKPRTTDFVEKP